MRAPTTILRSGWRRGLSATLAVGLIAGGLAVTAPPAANAATAPLATFTDPAGTAWTVPAGVAELRVALAGAAGSGVNGSSGGAGDTVSFTVPVRPGDRVVAYGATAGGGKNAHTAGKGFRNGGTGGEKSGGAKRGGGGGGASALTINNTVVAVAGGGAGAGGSSFQTHGCPSCGIPTTKVTIPGGSGGDANEDGWPGVGTHAGSAGVGGKLAARSGGSGSDAAFMTVGGGGGGGGGGWASGGGGGAGRKFGGNSGGGGGGGGTSYVADTVRNAQMGNWADAAPAGSVHVKYSVAAVTELVLPQSASRTAPITATVSAAILSASAGTTASSAANGSIAVFTADGELLGQTPLHAGTGQIPIAGLAEGTHTLTAVFTPADGGEPSEDEASITILAPAAADPGTGSELSATSTAMALPGSAPVFGTPLTVGVSVTATPAAALEGAEVRVMVDGIPAASATLDAAGTAEVALPATLSAGTHSLQASFRGTAEAAPSTSPAEHVTIATATALVSLSASSDALVYGEPIDASVTVGPLLGGSGTPSGLVLLGDGSELLAMQALDADGRAAFDDVILPAGSTQLFASYGGDEDFADAVSAPIDIAMTDAGTTTTLTVTPATAHSGTATTLEALVRADEPSLADPHGTVEFLVDGESFATMAVGDDADQTSRNGLSLYALETEALPTGAKEVRARFTGTDGFDDAASAAVSIDRTAWATVTAASAGTPDGHTVAITAGVAVDGPASGADPGTALPAVSGVLQAHIGADAVGEPVEAGLEESVLTVSGLPAGTHTVRVVYTPEDGRLAGSETSVSVVVAATPVDPAATDAASPTAATTAALARTGAELSAWPLAALALLLAGALVLGAGRRRAAATAR